MKGQIKLSDIKSYDLRRYTIQYNQDELEQMAPDKIHDWGEYIEMNDEMKVLRERIKKATLPYLIEGESGIGKTLMIFTLAKELGYALVVINCGDNTKERDLFGSPQIDGNGSYWNAGKLALAYKGLRLYKKVIIFFDDLGNLPPEIQLQLLSLCDRRKSIDVAGQVLHVGEDEKLMVVATTNPPIYLGVNPITQSLRSRLIGESRPHTTREMNKKILNWKGIPIDTVQSPLLTMAYNTHDLAVKNHITYVLSPRDLEQFIEIYNDNDSLGIKQEDNIIQCIKQTILIKYTDLTEKETIKERCKETFGVEL